MARDARRERRDAPPPARPQLQQRTEGLRKTIVPFDVSPGHVGEPPCLESLVQRLASG